MFCPFFVRVSYSPDAENSWIDNCMLRCTIASHTRCSRNSRKSRSNAKKLKQHDNKIKCSLPRNYFAREEKIENNNNNNHHSVDDVMFCTKFRYYIVRSSVRVSTFFSLFSSTFGFVVPKLFFLCVLFALVRPHNIFIARRKLLRWLHFHNNFIGAKIHINFHILIQHGVAWRRQQTINNSHRIYIKNSICVATVPCGPKQEKWIKIRPKGNRIS